MFKNFRIILRITPRDIMNFIKAAGRFLRNLLPALVFFPLLLLNSSVGVFATSGGFITDKNPSSGTVYNGDYTKYYSQSEALKEFEYDDHMFLHLYEYLVRYSELYSIPDLDSASPTVSNFLRTLALHFQCTGSLTPSLVVKPMPLGGLRLVSYDYTYDDTYQNGELSNLFLKLCPVKIGEKYLCYLKDNIFYFLLEDDDIFCVTPDCMGGFVSSGDFILGSSTLKNEVIPALNKQYFPKNATGKMSYRTDERFHNKYDGTSVAYNNMDFYSGRWGFAPVGGGEEMYIVFFLQNGSDTYYGKWQFHFKVTKEDVWYDDRDEVEYTGYTLTCEFWDMIDGSSDNPTIITVAENTEHSYFSINPVKNSDYLFFTSYSSYDHYITDLNTSNNYIRFLRPFLSFSYRNSFFIGYNSDLSTSLNFYNSLSHFVNSLNNHDTSCTDYGSAHDFGYVASVSPISTIYNIDTSKIPDDYVITVNGDTVYDYSITNPVTGDTTTIDKFVINNYNFPQNSNPGGNSSGGSTSGNVTVGGQIDVSGKVDVGVDVNVSVPDININVNGGNGGNGGNGSSYSMPDTGFFESYLDNALEESTGIRKFIGDFFNTLPGQITELICLSIVIAVLCRILGR